MALAFAAQSDGHHGALSLCNAVLRAVRGEWRMAVAEVGELVRQWGYISILILLIIHDAVKCI